MDCRKVKGILCITGRIGVSLKVTLEGFANVAVTALDLAIEKKRITGLYLCWR
jgi:hypothetical protein